MRVFALLLFCSVMLACEGADEAANSPQSESAEETPAPSKATSPLRQTASQAPDGIATLFESDSDFAALPKPEAGDWLAEHPEKGQTYRQFVRSRPNKATGTRNTIYLQPIGKFDSPALPSFDVFADYATRFFGMRVEPALSETRPAFITANPSTPFGKIVSMLDALARGPDGKELYPKFLLAVIN